MLRIRIASVYFPITVNVKAYLLLVAAVWPGDGAIFTIFHEACAIDALVRPRIEPIVTHALLADFGVDIALLAECNCA